MLEVNEDSWIIHGNGLLGTFEIHGYICFRTSLAAPVIWAPFPITACPTLVKFFSFY